MNTTEVKKVYDEFSRGVHAVIIGHEKPIRELFLGMICGGHVLLEGVPGIGKTLLGKTLARMFSLQFSRVQFTPDLMPADVIGTNVFNFETRQFILVKGPIFTEVLLCDEINRTPPKTQSALLEAMEEKQATIDGKPHALPKSFFVIATQNPIEHEGTYPLPEAQLDRFLMKIFMGNPEAEQMKEILDRYSENPDQHAGLLEGFVPLGNQDLVEQLKQAVYGVHVDPKIVDYVVALHAESNLHPGLLTGISARASLHLVLASRAFAATEGRDYVTPDDLRAVAFPVLGHRILLKPDLEFEGTTPRQILEQLFEKLVVPK